MSGAATRVIQSGKFDDDVHYYLDTEKDFGYVIELGNAGNDSSGRAPISQLASIGRRAGMARTIR